MEWLAGTLLGSVATGIAVLAVAFMGFGLLGERLNWRTGALVVMGVFILFGAPMIAQKLMLLARDGEASASEQVAATPIPPSPQVPSNAPVYDPYAGAPCVECFERTKSAFLPMQNATCADQPVLDFIDKAVGAVPGQVITPP